MKGLCKESSNVGGLPGMVSVLHTWGSDMKYHVHLHCLITFGGLDVAGVWHYPKRPDRLAPYRDVNDDFRENYLSGLDKLIAKGEVLVNDVLQKDIDVARAKNWVVHHTVPSVDTAILEEYLSRYIMKIAVSNSRLSFDEVKEQVHLIYNDYSSQLEGEAAPKSVKVIDPLSFIHQLLQHQTPKRFQKIRYYGLHSTRVYKRVAPRMSDCLKREPLTVRTIYQIVRQLLGLEMQVCPECGGFNLEQIEQAPDTGWLQVNVRGYGPRAPPKQSLHTAKHQSLRVKRVGRSLPKSVNSRGKRHGIAPNLSIAN